MTPNENSKGTTPSPKKSDPVVYQPLLGAPEYRAGSDGSIWSSVHHTEETINGWTRLKATPDRDGYLRVSIYGKARHVHTLVCGAFHGRRPWPHYQACHNDGHNQNNQAGNLRWGTPKENKADQETHGTVVRGERHHRAKTTDEQIASAGRLFDAGWTQKQIAEALNVTQPTVSRWLAGKRRKSP